MTLTIEQELEKTRREIEVLREEHKNFLYKVSHDLNAPIRHIDGFSNLILSSNFEQFDDETKKYFDIIMKSNLQLGAMLDALLKLSRLNTRQNPFQVIDANTMFKHIVSGSLADHIKTSSGTVNVEKLPHLFGDPDHMIILFEELLKNALNFVSSDTEPRVHVKAEAGDTESHFEIADNGIGVAPKLRESIFELFKRDVHRDEFPGQGVGLAMVMKIIERHNGKIWVEDNLPNGSIFHVTLPNAVAP